MGNIFCCCKKQRKYKNTTNRFLTKFIHNISYEEMQNKEDEDNNSNYYRIILNDVLYNKSNNNLIKSAEFNSCNNNLQVSNDRSILLYLMIKIIEEKTFNHYYKQRSLFKRNINEDVKAKIRKIRERMDYINDEYIREMTCDITDMSFPRETLADGTSIIAEKGPITYFEFAYKNKYSIVLSPDMIWKCLCIRILKSHKEKTDFNYDSTENNSMSDNIQKLYESVKNQNIIIKKWESIKNDVRDDDDDDDDGYSRICKIKRTDIPRLSFKPSFTTTKPENKILFSMVVANETREGIQPFSIGCDCGMMAGENIPSVIVEGTPADWILLKDNFNRLYNLLNEDVSLSYINNILDNIIKSFDKKCVDVNFWKNMYYNYDDKNEWARGAFSGWISIIVGCGMCYHDIPYEINYVKCGENLYMAGVSRIHIDKQKNLIRLCDDIIQFTMTPFENLMLTIDNV